MDERDARARVVAALHALGTEPPDGMAARVSVRAQLDGARRRAERARARTLVSLAAAAALVAAATAWTAHAEVHSVERDVYRLAEGPWIR